MMNNNKILIFIVLAFLFLNCKEEKVKIIPDGVSQKGENDSLKEFDFNHENTFPVFQIINNEYAITIPVSLDANDKYSLKFSHILKKDSFPWVYNKPMKDYEYIDSLKSTSLIYNKRFEQSFLQDLKSEYFLYGTKGAAKSSISRIIFQSSECGNDAIYYVLNFDKTKVGFPLIASEFQLDISYNEPPKDIIKKINNIAKMENLEVDYGGNLYKATVFGSYNDYYFSYFEYTNKNGDITDGKTDFPERLIFKKNKRDELKLVWGYQHDLLGLPCL